MAMDKILTVLGALAVAGAVALSLGLHWFAKNKAATAQGPVEKQMLCLAAVRMALCVVAMVCFLLAGRFV